MVLAHQGYDSRVFFPTGVICKPDREADSSVPSLQNRGEIPESGQKKPIMVFSGGKLEFRKGQDIAVEAFKRFRQTPEGKDAVLVTAWDNQWPKTMDGIWLSGYVKGVPQVRNGRADIVPWLVANGLPADSVIDCGRLTPPEAAHVMRSCTVGIFPNRAESGTNMVLVEALASGLYCVMTGQHGQADASLAFAPVAPWLLNPREEPTAVPQGCPLYRSTEGWVEANPDEIVTALQRSSLLNHDRQSYASYWSWESRGPAMAEAIVDSAGTIEVRAWEDAVLRKHGNTRPVGL